MQDYLPEIQALLSDWYLLTLSNPLYAGALVLTVWLCLVFFYNIKVLFLKKKQKVSEQGRIELQSQLDTIQQDLKQSEAKLADSEQQAEQNAQAAADFVEQVKERNLAVVAAIRALAAKFDLNEQLVGSDSDMKAKFIWQQQDNVVAQLTERLEAAQKINNEREAIHQQEIGQLKEKEALISSLHATLDAQTKQFAQLEQALEAQKLSQQAQQNEAQQLLASTLEKHQLDFTRLLNDLKNQTSVQTQVVQEALVVEPKKAEPVVGDKIELPSEPEVIIPEPIQPVIAASPINTDTDTKVDVAIPEAVVEPVVIEAPEVVIPEASPSSENTEDLQVPTIEPDVPSEPIEPISEREIVQPDIVNIIQKETPVADEMELEEPDYNASSLHLGGAFKGLLGKMTAKKKANDKPVVKESEQAEKKAKKSPFKLKGLYSNLKSKGK
ncbi:MAG: hypothetical protein DRQ62_11195 [Gammaproteobacteria bacterium]|nr:MAG: hypothetical protein DRQ62_11195 [Gammaproteobacteria bacterium]